MKVLLVNGSPKANGNTARALAEVAEQLTPRVSIRVFQLGAKPFATALAVASAASSIAAAPLTTTW